MFSVICYALAPKMNETMRALVIIALATTSCRTGATVSAEKPHVVLFIIDTLRADHLGCYGYHRDTSPRIDALVREMEALAAELLAQVRTIGENHRELKMGEVDQFSVSRTMSRPSLS